MLNGVCMAMLWYAMALMALVLDKKGIIGWETSVANLSVDILLIQIMIPLQRRGLLGFHNAVLKKNLQLVGMMIPYVQNLDILNPTDISNPTDQSPLQVVVLMIYTG